MVKLDRTVKVRDAAETLIFVLLTLPFRDFCTVHRLPRSYLSQGMFPFSIFFVIVSERKKDPLV